MPSVQAIAPAPLLEGELLRAFVAFAAHRNFTIAARSVGLSQPALFERVRRLQELVGRPLYEKQGRTLHLTDDGVRVAAWARELRASAQGFAEALRGERPTEQVVVAAGEGAWLYVLAAPMDRFLARSSMRVVPRALGGPSAIAALKCGEVDAAVAVVDIVPRGVVADDLMRVPVCAAVPARSPLARRRTLQARDLADERLILAPAGQGHRDVVGRAIAGDATVGFSAADTLEADGWPLMLAWVAAGLGVAVVNGCCEAPRGVKLVPLPALGHVTYRLLTRSSSPSSVRTLRDALVAGCSGHR